MADQRQTADDATFDLLHAEIVTSLCANAPKDDQVLAPLLVNTFAHFMFLQSHRQGRITTPSTDSTHEFTRFVTCMQCFDL